MPYFAPTVLEGTSGQTLHLHIANTTPALHNFTIREESVDRDIAVGSAVDVVVVFPTHGALVFFCRFHGEADGHAGELFTVPS